MVSKVRVGLCKQIFFFFNFVRLCSSLKRQTSSLVDAFVQRNPRYKICPAQQCGQIVFSQNANETIVFILYLSGWLVGWLVPLKLIYPLDVLLWFKMVL